jgi:hypothetical protein
MPGRTDHSPPLRRTGRSGYREAAGRLAAGRRSTPRHFGKHPMNGFDRLSQCAGEWTGHNRVQPDISTPAEESSSRLSVTPILDGTFLRLDQQWGWKDTPQSGSLLIGYLPKEESATIHWVDTWHNGRGSMNLVGRFTPEGKLVAHGHFAVQSGPDWGWRIEIQPDGDQLTINMFCVNPANGQDEGWVWSTYSRRTT